MGQPEPPGEDASERQQTPVWAGPFVLDASLALSWCFEDESAEQSEAVLEALQGVRALAPAIWPLEVANALLVAERRRRLTEAQTTSLLRVLGELDVEVEFGSPALAWGAVLAVARRYGLSVYDATYLELAMRKSVPLATLDERLAAAADAAGVARVGGPRHLGGPPPDGGR